MVFGGAFGALSRNPEVGEVGAVVADGQVP
jgi:hypothetical protein